MTEDSLPPQKSSPTGDTDVLEEKQILRDRARKLAQEVQAKDAGESIEVIEFLLAYETYAVETRFVREVRTLKDLTPLPCTPPFVAGIINVRSQILPVIEMKRFFDLPDKGIADLHHVLILQSPAMEVAILADLIRGHRRIQLEHVQTSLPTLSGIRAEYLRGITPEGVVILDVEKVLSSQRIIVYNEP